MIVCCYASAVIFHIMHMAGRKVVAMQRERGNLETKFTEDFVLLQNPAFRYDQFKFYVLFSFFLFS